MNPKNKEVDVSTNPLVSDTLNLSYIDKEGMLLEYENEEKSSLVNWQYIYILFKLFLLLISQCPD